MLVNLRKTFLKLLTRTTQGSKAFATAIKMNEPVVTVGQGKLKGAVEALVDGTLYYSFKGIPYAQPPVGKHRFTAPLPPQPWSGTYQATKHGPICPQYDMISTQLLEGDEDCLFLNVYTRSLPSDSKKPVMVYIHGGGFMSGSGGSTMYGPEFLLEHDVILVTINYRLEVLGFLSLDTPEVPGNAGMKDQVFALRWVQNNISQFGGDPNNVTLWGESAGSSSVLFHMQSPMSKGLFHKAIAQSGVSINDWACGQDCVQRAFRLAKVLGKETDRISEVLEYLRSVPAIKLAKTTMKTMTVDEKYRGFSVSFAPVVEKKFDNVEPFLTEDPLDSLLSKKMNDVPLIIGYTSAEGLMTISYRLSILKFINDNTNYLVPREIAQKISENKVKEFGHRIRSFYVGNREFTTDDAEEVCKLYSDLHFVYNIHRYTHFYSSIKPTYMYKFNLESDLNISKSILGVDHMKGTCHADDMWYLFRSALNKDIYDEQEKTRDYVYRMTKMWTDFAKTSEPTPDNNLGVKWTPYSKAAREYLEIEDKMSMNQFADRERIEAWNKLYLEAGLPCVTKSTL